MEQRVLWGMVGAFAFLSAATITGCRPAMHDALPGGAQTYDIGPAKQCTWVYSGDGLEAFKKATTHPDFDPRFNAFVTVSRRSFTARVVGTLTDEFVRKQGGMAGVKANFPWLVPVKQTAFHEVIPDDPEKSAAERHEEGKTTGAGSIVKTTIVNLPPNSVMIVYPVAVALPRDASGKRYNTLAGNWRFLHKIREKGSNSLGAFGRFPFLQYAVSEHAFHGPIEISQDDMWHVRRGQVSHGCQRMQGEHALELAVLFGCGGDPAKKRCPDPVTDPNNPDYAKDAERVTVMEEYDYIPRPDLETPLPEGEYKGSWDEVFGKFVVVDTDYPSSTPLVGTGKIFDKEGVFLDRTKVERAPRNNRAGERPFAFLQRFPTWDNRDKHLAWGIDCR